MVISVSGRVVIKSKFDVDIYLFKFCIDTTVKAKRFWQTSYKLVTGMSAT